MKKIIAATITTLVCAALSVASASVSDKVQKAMRGKILIAEGGLPAARSTDSATIEYYKKVNLKTIKHASEEDDVYSWNIDYTAFLKKAPKARSLSFEFYTDDKEKLFVADKRLMGVDPTLKILNGSFSINEDDGVNRKRKYIIKLVGKVKKRDFTFAETRVTLE